MTDELLVLHTLRCIGFAGLARIAATTGLSAADAELELIDLAGAGQVMHAKGDFGGWGLTEAGRAADAQRIADELATAGTRAAVVDAYERFLVLNPELLDLCTAWQLRSVDGTPTTNDHSDPDYDTRVLHRFVDFDQRAKLVCADLAAALPRFARYSGRLDDALARARSGAWDYLADNLASYHVIWFQLHEDLLATLGLPR